jgi:NAD(P)-dependent dehydrogenase (short-subunit alcohol dehydrogenase family)
MRTFANSLAEHSIRVNTIHPTGVRTAMIENEAMEQFLAAFPDAASTMTNLLPVEVLEANDISDTVVFLASDAAKYITGVTLPVDAGFTAK